MIDRSPPARPEARNDPALEGAPSLRRAGDVDHPWIATLAAEVYRDLGDYGTVMPQWLVQPGVLAWIAEQRGERLGFAVLGFYQERPGGERTHEGGRTVADLLAIGVTPPHQRRGIGSQLLRHVIAVVGAIAPAHGIPDLRLTVAHTNVVGQRWYLRSGFRVLEGEHGTYANGQRAIRMARPLPEPRARPPRRSAPSGAPPGARPGTS